MTIMYNTIFSFSCNQIELKLFENIFLHLVKYLIPILICLKESALKSLLCKESVCIESKTHFIRRQNVQKRGRKHSKSTMMEDKVEIPYNHTYLIYFYIFIIYYN